MMWWIMLQRASVHITYIYISIHSQTIDQIQTDFWFDVQLNIIIHIITTYPTTISEFPNHHSTWDV